MLISITEKCRMNCPHCMDDARADSDKFMTFDTFKDAVAFNDKYDKFTMITGGEPTEHPEFWNFLEYCINQKTTTSSITVVTNGMNLETDNNARDKIERLTKLNPKVTLFFQVTNVQGLYPIKIQTHKSVFHMKNVVLFTSMNDIPMYPQGRAKGKDYDFSAHKAPMCFNIRSSVITSQELLKSITVLRSSAKFCTPQIGYDGSIKVGESTLCPAVSHISKSEKEIVHDITEFRCKGCKESLDKLHPFIRSIIGEN